MAVVVVTILNKGWLWNGQWTVLAFKEELQIEVEWPTLFWYWRFWWILLEYYVCLLADSVVNTQFMSTFAESVLCFVGLTAVV